MYEFKFNNREYTLDFWDDQNYLKTDNKVEDKALFNDIYEALDGIVLGGKTIRQFNFESIS